MLRGQTDRRCVSTPLVPEPQRQSPDSAITIPRTSLRSFHPSAPASRSRGRPLNSASGARRRAPAPATVQPGKRGKEGTHPGPRAPLHPQQTYCKVGSK